MPKKFTFICLIYSDCQSVLVSDLKFGIKLRFKPNSDSTSYRDSDLKFGI